jgi:hypothetical protein
MSKQIINGEVDFDEFEEQIDKDNKEMQEQIDTWEKEVPEELAAQEFLESMAITRGN